MVPARSKDLSSSWCPKHTNSCNSICDAPIKLDQGLLANRSATIASLLRNNPSENLSAFIKEIPLEREALELIARFCQGLEVKMTTDNVIPLICLSNYLEMTENHSPNNLLHNAIIFLEDEIIPSWDQTIKSLRASGCAFQQAADNGLLKLCIEALTDCALSDPALLGQPIMVERDSSSSKHLYYKNATRRKLFAGAEHLDTSSEDLASLPVKMYEPIIKGMIQGQVRQENIIGSLHQYLKKHAADVETIEAIERLLPASTFTCNNKYPLYPYTLLFEMYTSAVFHGASAECIASLENRIGKELYRSTAEDLLKLDLDVESLRQILKAYYANFTEANPAGLVTVAELMENYLVQVAKERETDVRSFTELAQMASSTSNVGDYRCSDGIYKAVDLYLDMHRELIESEKEEICRVLDFQKMSSEACQHAALNQKLPLRVVVQVLFVSQLQLKDNISKAVVEYPSISSVKHGQQRGSEEIRVVEEDQELDDEKEEIQGCHEKNCCGKKSKKKVGLWKGMKRKFGCMGSNDYEILHDCSCQTTKKNKKEHS
ncbi:BTB/POZ domain-containing protein At5g17580-like [Chenopodium quinoa]|uniref:BTB/POZ domain-containing protein At5g17580-like n=1 Tax=Chenopodium quinoa TaxID=63459 RepID=UPI000B7752EE|nr:BTB/POZ domain-containing protein At5g17580-like [Chenopodium quinoa]